MPAMEPTLGSAPFVVLNGTIDSQLIDGSSMIPTNILDRTVANGVNVQWHLSGLNAHLYLADTFTLTAYLETASGGANQSFSTTVLGSSGIASGTGYNRQLDFPFPAAPAKSINIPANSVATGVYRVTVVLSESIVNAPVRIAGFVDLGMVEFYQP